jgi:hypothetical protein
VDGGVDDPPGRKDRHPVGERQQRHQRQPKVGERVEENGYAAEDALSGPATSRRLVNAEAHTGGDAQGEGDAHQEKRPRNRDREDVPHRGVAQERVPELPLRDADDVAGILLGERTIEPEVGPPLPSHVFRDARILEPERVTFRQVGKKETGRRHEDDDDQRLQKSAGEIPPHDYGVAAASPTRSRAIRSDAGMFQSASPAQ